MPEEVKQKMKCQEKLDFFFAYVFSKWGLIVAGNPKKVFWGSIGAMLLLSLGILTEVEFEEPRLAWTPTGNPSVVASERAAEMFPASGGFVGVIAEAKEGVDNIITLEAMREIERFERMMKEMEVEADGTKFGFDTICIKAGPKCVHGKGPLSFISDVNGARLDHYKSDADILRAV